MATGATEWVWEHSRASNGPLILLLVIAREIDAKGNCTMTVAEMASRSRLSERSVQSALREGERLGDLKVTPCGRSGYSLWLAMGADSAPLPDSKGADIAPPQNLHPAESAPQPRPKPQVKAKGAESAPPEISDMYLTVTGSSLVTVKDVPAKPPRRRSDGREDVTRLCDHLASRIEANVGRRPNISEKWRDAARLMLDADGRTEQEVMGAINWSQNHEFWRANILSMPKLREKYDQLLMQAKRGTKPSANQESNLDVVARYIQRVGNGNTQ